MGFIDAGFVEERLIMREAEPIRQRLRNLEQMLPGQPEIVYRFAEHLASKLTGPRVGMLLYFVSLGDVPHITRSKRRQKLIVDSIPQIIAAVCDKEFAQAILEHSAGIDAIAAASPKKIGALALLARWIGLRR